MLTYRLYELSAVGGHIFKPPFEFEADNDASALNIISDTAFEPPAEIWEGERCVARLPAVSLGELAT